MSPFYHLVLPFDKLIVLDADIEFKSSPELLHAQFSRFVAGQVAGVAKEMSQLYRLLLIRHRSGSRLQYGVRSSPPCPQTPSS